MMHLTKRLALLLIGLISGLELSAQTIPVKVREAFNIRYPEARKTDWEQESDAEYEVEFLLGKQELTAYFDAEGRWLKTEREIRRSEVPVEVSEAMEKEFSDFEVTEVFIQEAPGSGTVYNLSLKSGKERRRMLYRADGSRVGVGE